MTSGRYQPAIGHTLREVIILITGREWTQNFEAWRKKTSVFLMPRLNTSKPDS